MSKRISILHFLSNYIIVLLPIFTLCVMGPTEIYFGNYKELGFTYQEFGWKFLFFSFLITTLLLYKVETFLEVVPRTREGILGYLSCGSLKGIGPKTAERIVNRFGLDTLEVMEKYPQELLKIQGISQQKLDRIVDSFGKNKVFRDFRVRC